MLIPGIPLPEKSQKECGFSLNFITVLSIAFNSVKYFFPEMMCFTRQISP